MKRIASNPAAALLLGLLFVACVSSPTTGAPTATTTSTSTPGPTATASATPTVTPIPSPTLTLRPTRTPWPTATLPPSPLPEPVPLSEEALAALVPDGAIARFGIGSLDLLIPSPDGSRIAVGGTVGIHVFETRSLEHLWSAPTQSPVKHLDWSADGTLIAAGLQEEGFAVFDAATGAEQWRYDSYLKMFNDYFHDIAVGFSPDSQYLATSGCMEKSTEYDGCCGNSVVHLWDADSGRLIATQPGGAHSFRWSADSRLLINEPRPVEDWDIVSDTVTPILNRPELGSHGAVIFSPDLTMIAFGGADAIVVATWPEGEMLHSIPFSQLATDDEYILIWSPDSSHLITHRRVDYGDPYVRDIATGGVVTLPSADIGMRIWGLLGKHYAWSPDGTRIAALLTRRPGIGIWDLRTGELLQEISSVHLTDIWHVAWPQPESLVLTQNVRWYGTWRLITLNPGNALVPTTMVEGSDIKLSLRWSPDGRRLLVGGMGTITIWDAASRRPVRTCRNPGRSLAVVRINWLESDPSLVVAYNWEWPNITLWNLDTCTVEVSIEQADSILSPDGSLILDSAGRAHPVRELLTGELSSLYDPPRVSRYGEVLPDYAAPEDMEWSPDGRLVAAAVNERLVVWRTDTGEELVGQEQDISATGIISCCIDPIEVHQLAWAPDSSLVAIAEQQREGTRLTIVEARTGEIVYRRTLSHGDPFVIDPWVAWAPDGERVALFEPYYQMDDEGNVSERAYLSVHHIPSGEVQTVVELGQSNAWEFPLVISEMTWSPEGRFIVTVHGGIAHAPEGWFGNIGDDAAIYFWGPETGALVRALRGHANDIVDIAWSPDGRTLASASIDGTVILWDLAP